MDLESVVRKCSKLCDPYRVVDGCKFNLTDFDPDDTGKLGAEDKLKAQQGLALGVQALTEFQELLYAQDKWAVLLVFQAMDAAGKDGAIKHVLSGVNPQGCQVVSFKAPSAEELDHDYLWRCSKALPERGRIGIFNRSYYEEVLVVRVHPEFLTRQKLPESLTGKGFWKKRFREIRNFEEYLSRNGVLIRKFFLHVSPEEQKKRFLERLDNPEKHWKFSSADVEERRCWKDYMDCYEDAIRQTATEEAPWFVVPADNKWYTRLVVAAAVVEALGSLNLRFPEVGEERKKELLSARQRLLTEEMKT